MLSKTPPNCGRTFFIPANFVETKGTAYEPQVQAQDPLYPPPAQVPRTQGAQIPQAQASGPDRRLPRRPQGYGFVSVPGKEEDYFIPRSDTNGAAGGDLVRIQVPDPRRTKARVLSVERTNDGTLESAQAAILFRYSVSPDFPPEVDLAAQAVAQAVSPAEAENRADFRGLCVVTIDSASAKDLDDAVSLTFDDRGRRVLGVHIADVSHYVEKGSPLDLEAFQRGTSVYYVNQVAPCFPRCCPTGSAR